MTLCNRRFKIQIRVHYRNGLYEDETHLAWGLTHIEAENDLLERRDRSPDADYIQRVELLGCVEITDGVYSGGAA